MLKIWDVKKQNIILIHQPAKGNIPLACELQGTRMRAKMFKSKKPVSARNIPKLLKYPTDKSSTSRIT